MAQRSEAIFFEGGGGSQTKLEVSLIIILRPQVSIGLPCVLEFLGMPLQCLFKVSRKLDQEVLLCFVSASRHETPVVQTLPNRIGLFSPVNQKA